jgi:hypothetical protein
MLRRPKHSKIEVVAPKEEDIWCIYIYIHTHIYIHIYTDTHIYIYTHTHTYTHTHLYKRGICLTLIHAAETRANITKNATNSQHSKSRSACGSEQNSLQSVLKLSPFCAVTWRRFVAGYRHFGTTYRVPSSRVKKSTPLRLPGLLIWNR